MRGRPGGRRTRATSAPGWSDWRHKPEARNLLPLRVLVPVVQALWGPRISAEELVAELCSAFLCAEFDIDGELRHAGYIENWIQLLKDDARAFFTAASAAQKAADHIRQAVLAADAGADEMALAA